MQTRNSQLTSMAAGATKSGLSVLLCLLLLGCAVQKPDADRWAVEDFISVHGLEQVNYIRTSATLRRDSMRYLNEYHMHYQALQNHYLVAFSRRCPHEQGTVITDVRSASNILKAQSDTIRGCGIARIYRMTKAEVDQLESLGKAPPFR